MLSNEVSQYPWEDEPSAKANQLSTVPYDSVTSKLLKEIEDGYQGTGYRFPKFS
jgi:hypothetical protein